MTNEEIYAIIERETGRFVDGSTPLLELNIDSLEFLDLLLEINKETGLTAPDAKIHEFKTVGDLVRALA